MIVRPSRAPRQKEHSGKGHAAHLSEGKSSVGRKNSQIIWLKT
ncbi:hypothetical protein GCWU000325_00701 [Alloprevotella tannerae ATCC 51259]|uniref:Uncharacterized protein n=1 Tax=Alloprevotella tannerae ATCC 51259 TaxID=626522 RepID=C9LES0_9BACT|nr:hypothetical protein GCWU000325_00701 [Alloprevotella tannerae ATCC 51259]